MGDRGCDLDGHAAIRGNNWGYHMETWMHLSRKGEVQASHVQSSQTLFGSRNYLGLTSSVQPSNLACTPCDPAACALLRGTFTSTLARHGERSSPVCTYKQAADHLLRDVLYLVHFTPDAWPGLGYREGLLPAPYSIECQSVRRQNNKAFFPQDQLLFRGRQSASTGGRVSSFKPLLLLSPTTTRISPRKAPASVRSPYPLTARRPVPESP